MSRIKILEALMRIHSAGVQHNDIKPDNILLSDDDEVRIIDFDLAMEHNCKRKLPIELYEYKPLKYEFGCYEIFEVAEAMGIWTPSKHDSPSAEISKLTMDMD